MRPDSQPAAKRLSSLLGEQTLTCAGEREGGREGGREGEGREGGREKERGKISATVMEDFKSRKEGEGEGGKYLHLIVWSRQNKVKKIVGHFSYHYNQ